MFIDKKILNKSRGVVLMQKGRLEIEIRGERELRSRRANDGGEDEDGMGRQVDRDGGLRRGRERKLC